MSFDGFIFFFSFILFAEAKAEIIGPSIRYLTPGSTLKLMCRITQNTESSAFIFWYNDNRMINYDFDRGINVSTEAGKLRSFYYLYNNSTIILKLIKETKKWSQIVSLWHTTSNRTSDFIVSFIVFFLNNCWNFYVRALIHLTHMLT